MTGGPPQRDHPDSRWAMVADRFDKHTTDRRAAPIIVCVSSGGDRVGPQLCRAGRR
ncbi:MAG: hypothetical protein MZV70_41970 [Desulfobacterales bacterium]|nr:hypothetical protein [Desulfobacterales bacterium]